MIIQAEVQENPRFLITGLNGLIGWNLFDGFRKDYETFGTFRREHARLSGPNVFKIDLDQEEALVRLIAATQPDYLIHAWAMCDLDLCEQEPQMAERINVQGTRNMLNAVKQFPFIRKIIFISTDHVFGGDKGNYNEEDLPDPKHVYGRTKFEAECLIRSSNLPYLIIRPGLVIGSSLQGNKGPRDFLFYRLRLKRPIHYFTDEWRSPIAAEHLVNRVKSLVLSHQTGIFHIAGERIMNRYQLAHELAGNAGVDTSCLFPRLRREDRWAHIRPYNLSLKSMHNIS